MATQGINASAAMPQTASDPGIRLGELRDRVLFLLLCILEKTDLIIGYNSV
jgi:Mg2+ and Co2+ transporter CorA